MQHVKRPSIPAYKGSISYSITSSARLSGPNRPDKQARQGQGFPRQEGNEIAAAMRIASPNGGFLYPSAYYTVAREGIRYGDTARLRQHGYSLYGGILQVSR